MKSGQLQVMGVSRYEKDGRKSWTLHAITPFDSWEIGTGFKVISEWTNKCDLSNLTYGQIVEPVYTKGYQGKAVLSNVRIVESPSK